MKFVRFLKDNEISYGVLEDNSIIKKIQGNIVENYTITEKNYKISEVKLLSPCQPSKIICIGLNYKDNAQKLGLHYPSEPMIFLKPPTSVIGPNEEIIYPNKVEKLFFEGELAVILKDKVKNIEPNEVDNHILGYTCFNDITAVDIIEKDKGQLTRGKYFDTFSAIGPAIVTDLPVENLQIISKRNGEIKQNSNTNQMIFSVRQIVSFISKIMTLTPFDIIATGTPAGACEIKRGNNLEIIIEQIGVLNNKVR